MMMLRVFTLLLILVAGVFAQSAPPLTGSLTRNLGDNFWAARTNAYPLGQGDMVGIFRGGVEVNQGVVMRTNGEECTIKLTQATEVVAGDGVARLKVNPNGLGPTLPSQPRSTYTRPSYKEQWRPTLRPGKSTPTYRSYSW